VLGGVSLLMDISSEMIHSLLPMFLVGTLGVSMLAVGLIEGVAESTALIVKVFSGVLSDRLGQRKGLTLLGYGLGAATKPLFALAQGAGLVVAARFVDRVGKGIRGAPRDALLADITPTSQRGAAYGLHQALDALGAVAGPLLATVLMLAWANDFRAVFWVAVLPGALAVALLALGVREPQGTNGSAPRPPLNLGLARQLGGDCWRVVAMGALFSLARFSEAFLVLRAQQVGIAVAWVPLVMVLMNLVFATSAYPFGWLTDRVRPERLLGPGLLALLLADAALALASGPWGALCGVLLWGIHLGMTQGLLSAWVANTAPAELRGTAFGVFNLACGVAMLLASVGAGWLWDRFGAPATFGAGAALAALAWAGTVCLRQVRHVT
jgi:MFS family permease